MFIYIRSTAFVIVVTQKLFLQQSKNVTAKCTENLSPSPCILFSLSPCIDGNSRFTTVSLKALSDKHELYIKVDKFFNWLFSDKNLMPTFVDHFSASYLSEKYLIFEKYYLVLFLLCRLDNLLKKYYLLLWQVVRGFWLL